MASREIINEVSVRFSSLNGEERKETAKICVVVEQGSTNEDHRIDRHLDKVATNHE